MRNPRPRGRSATASRPEAGADRTVTELAAFRERRAPQPPRPQAAPPPGASPTLSAVAVFYQSEGARQEREWWIETLGPWARRMWAAAHPASMAVPDPEPDLEAEP